MESHNAKPKSVHWFEPKWSYRPRLKAELSQILNLKMWLRIMSVIVLLTVALAYAVNRAVPDLEFNWFAALATGIGALAIGMTGMATVLWFVPPQITINHKAISRQQGQSSHSILPGNIRCITIDTTNPARPLLHVETADRPLECGVAVKVSPLILAQFLRELFPELLVVEKR